MFRMVVECDFLVHDLQAIELHFAMQHAVQFFGMCVQCEVYNTFYTVGGCHCGHD